MTELSRTETEQVAGNGLLHRRMFLAAGGALGAAALGTVAMTEAADAAPLPVESWMKIPGAPFNGYGQPSKFEEKVKRTWASAPGTGRLRRKPSNGSNVTNYASKSPGPSPNVDP